jgi:hypothetical protein
MAGGTADGGTAAGSAPDPLGEVDHSQMNH